MTPRRCQQEAAAAALAEVERGASGVVRMVTRSGKSIAIGLVLRRLPALKVAVVTSRTLLVHDLELTLWRLLDPAAQSFPAAAKDREAKEVRRALSGSTVIGRWDGHRRRPGRVVVTTYASLEALIGSGFAPDLLILDEAHRSAGVKVREIVERYPRIGWTATPHAGKPLPFDRLIYDYGAERAIEDGVIVPWVRVELDGEPADLASPLDTLDALITMVTARGGPDQLGPGIVTAPNLTTARAMAERMRAAGWSAVAAVPRVAGQEGLTQGGMRRLLRRLGEVGGVVVTVDWLAEGITMPAARWLGLCAAPRGRVHLCQVAGRIMGTCQPDRWGAKVETLIFDPARILRTHKLEHPAQLGEVVKLPKSVKAQTKAAMARLVALPWAERVSAEERWTRGLVEALTGRARDEKVPWCARPLEGPARGLPATDSEWRALGKMVGALRWLSGPDGERHRVAIRAVIEGRTACAGTVRDLCRVLWLLRVGADRALAARGVPQVGQFQRARAVVRGVSVP